MADPVLSFDVEFNRASLQDARKKFEKVFLDAVGRSNLSKVLGRSGISPGGGRQLVARSFGQGDKRLEAQQKLRAALERDVARVLKDRTRSEQELIKRSKRVREAGEALARGEKGAAKELDQAAKRVAQQQSRISRLNDAMDKAANQLGIFDAFLKAQRVELARLSFPSEAKGKSTVTQESGRQRNRDDISRIIDADKLKLSANELDAALRISAVNMKEFVALLSSSLFRTTDSFEEVTGALTKSGVVIEDFSGVIRSQAIRAAKEYASSAAQAAQANLALSRQDINIEDNLNRLVRSFAGDIASRFGLVGQEVEDVNKRFVAELRKAAGAADKVTEEELKLAQQAASERKKRAIVEAKRLAQESVQRIDPEKLVRARRIDFGSVIDGLSKQFDLAGKGLSEVIRAFSDEFKKASDKKVKEFNKETEKQRKIDDAIADAGNKVKKAQLDRAKSIRRRLDDDSAGTGAPAIGLGSGGKFGGGINRVSDAADLPIEDQIKFNRALRDTSKSAKAASGNLKTHNGSIATGNALVKKLTKNLSVADKAAFQFGFSARDAAGRLLAWASPAAFIFETVGALRQAVTQLIELDTQARRLAFFQTGSASPLTAFAENAGGAAGQAGAASRNLSLITDEAKRTGLSIDEVTEAVIKLQRIGRDPFIEEDGVLKPTTFLKAVEGLARLEQAELNAGRAAEILESILRQNNLTAEDAVLVAAQLAEASNRTSLNVDQLGTVITGVSSAFRNLLNIGVRDQFLLASASVKAFGTNASRSRTILRQLAVRLSRNAEEFKEFGVAVTDASGNLRGIDALFDVFNRLNDLRGTVRQVELAQVVAEADQIQDVINLASSVSDLSKEYNRNATAQERAAEAAKAVANFQEASELQSNSAQAAINRFRTSLVELAEAAGAQNIVSGLVGGLTELVDSLKAIITFAQEAEGAFKALATGAGLVAVSQIARKLTLGFQGFAKGSIAKQLGENVAQGLDDALGKSAAGGSTEAVGIAQREGLISAERVSAIRRKDQSILGRIVNLEDQISVKEAKIAKAKSLTGTQSELVNREVRELNGLQDKLNRKVKEEERLRKRTRREITGQGKGLARALGGAILAGVGTVAITFGDELAKAASDNKEMEDNLSNSIQNAVFAGFAGAQIGSAIAPGIGTIVGGVIGAAVGGATTFFVGEEKIQQERIAAAAKHKKLVEETEFAFKRTLELTRLENKARQVAAERQGQGLADLQTLQNENIVLNEQINSLREQGKDTTELETQLFEKNIALKNLEIRLQQDQLELSKERLALEEQLLFIRNRSQLLEQSISLVRKSTIDELKEQGAEPNIVAEQELKFSKDSLAAQATAILQEISSRRLSIANLEREGAASKGDQDELKKLKKEEEKLERQLSDIRLKLVEEELDIRKRALEESNREVEEQLGIVQKASDEIISSLKNVVSSEARVVSLISQSANIFRALITDVRSLDEIRDELSDTPEAQARSLERQLRDLRNAQDATRGFIENQRRVLARTVRPIGQNDVEGQLQEAGRLAELVARRLADNASEEEKLNKKVAEGELENLNLRIDVTKRLLDIEEAASQRNVDVINQEIEIRRQQIQSIEEVIKREADVGRSLIEAPDQFIRGLRDIAVAQTALRGVSNPEELVNRVGQLQGGVGIAGLQRILEGLDAAVQNNIRIAEAFTPEQLRDAFLAAQTGRVDVAGGESEQEQLIRVIGGLNESLAAELAQQREILVRRAALEQISAKIAESTLNTNKEDLKTARESLEIAIEQRDIAQLILDELRERIKELSNATRDAIESDDFRRGIAELRNPLDKIVELLGKENRFNPAADAARALEEEKERQRIERGQAAARERFQQSFLAISDIIKDAGLAGTAPDEFLSQFPIQRFAAQLANVSADDRRRTIAEFADRLNSADVVDSVLELERSLSEGVEGSVRPDPAPNLRDRVSNEVFRELRGIIGPATADALRGIREANQSNPGRDDAVSANTRALQDSVARNAGLEARIVVLSEKLDLLTGAIENLPQEADEFAFPVPPGPAPAPKGGKRVGGQQPGNVGSVSIDKDSVDGLNAQIQNAISTAMDTAVASLRNVVQEGIKISESSVELQINANIQAQIAANDELRELLSGLTQDDAEVERIMRILGELAKIELERGTRLSPDAADAADGGR